MAPAEVVFQEQWSSVALNRWLPEQRVFITEWFLKTAESVMWTQRKFRKRFHGERHRARPSRNSTPGLKYFIGLLVTDFKHARPHHVCAKENIAMLGILKTMIHCVTFTKDYKQLTFNRLRVSDLI